MYSETCNAHTLKRAERYNELDCLRDGFNVNKWRRRICSGVPTLMLNSASQLIFWLNRWTDCNEFGFLCVRASFNSKINSGEKGFLSFNFSALASLMQNAQKTSIEWIGEKKEVGKCKRYDIQICRTRRIRECGGNGTYFSLPVIIHGTISSIWTVNEHIRVERIRTDFLPASMLSTTINSSPWRDLHL